MNVFDLQATLSLDTSGYDKGLDDAADSAKKAGSNIGSIFGGTLASNLATQGINAIMSGTQAAIGSITSLTQNAVDSYAQYEQLVGGVDKLYGDASERLQEYAENAYKTSGMSANQYMETATSFSAALINSLEGDVMEAADMTDVAMRAISDNVNTFGSSMESVTNAFQGFAKGNYTMLDNLKLGYGGTKSEMERLIADANEYRESIGETADLSIDSFADIVQAVQSVQEAQNIAGTTNKEAMSTIEGSAMAVKGAWQNVITAIGRGEGLDEALDGLLNSLFGGESGGGLIENMLPKFATALEGIGTLIERIAPIVSEKLPELIETLVPIFVGAISSLLISIANTLPSLISIVFDGILKMINLLLPELPGIFESLIQTIIGVFQSLADFLPDLIPTLVEVILGMVQIFIDNADLLIDAAINLIMALADGIMASLPILLEKAPELISSFIAVLFSAFYKLEMAGVELLMSVINGIIDCIPALLEAVGTLIPLIIIALVDEFPMLIQVGFDALEAIIGGFVDAIPSLLANLIAGVVLLIKAIGTTFIEYDWISLGKNIIQGIIDGIGSMGGAIAQAASNMASTVMDTLKSAFGIHSPSTVMRDQVGKMLALGLGEGFEENAPDLQGAIDDMMVEPSLSLSSEGIGGIGMTLAGSLNGLQVVAPIYIGNTLLDTFVADAITRQEYISGGR